jgi:hypothetical protein
MRTRAAPLGWPTGVAAHHHRGLHRLTDPAGVLAQRRGALERARWVLADWRTTTTRLAEVETRMVEVLDELDLTECVISIPEFRHSGRRPSWPKPATPPASTAPVPWLSAGLCPRENTSGTYTGQSRISRRGRPRLRLAAWRAVWGALPNNPVMAVPLPASDHQGAQSAQRRAGPRGNRRRPAALDPRHHHPARHLRRRRGRRRRAAHGGLTQPRNQPPKEVGAKLHSA